MLEKIKTGWEYVQDLLDIRGDVVMLAFSSAMIFRIVLAAFGKAPITASEAAAYASAVGAFGYYKGKPK